MFSTDNEETCDYCGEILWGEEEPFWCDGCVKLHSVCGLPLYTDDACFNRCIEEQELLTRMGYYIAYRRIRREYVLSFYHDPLHPVDKLENDILAQLEPLADLVAGGKFAIRRSQVFIEGYDHEGHVVRSIGPYDKI